MSDSSISEVRYRILQWVVPSSFITWIPIETLSFHNSLIYMPQQHMYQVYHSSRKHIWYMQYIIHEIYIRLSLYIEKIYIYIYIYNKWVHTITVTWNRIAETAKEGNRETHRLRKLSKVRRFMGFIGAEDSGCLSLINYYIGITFCLWFGISLGAESTRLMVCTLRNSIFYIFFDIVKERC